ncbi:MAG: TlpA disulfide reductase family protein [bacterium]|nr:TlpA disulfide reductase family protein [bacterium]
MRKLLLIMLAGLMVLSLGVAPVLAGPVLAGEMLPDTLSVKTLDGKELMLKSITQGKPSALIFFNTSCRNCLNEIKWVLRKHKDQNNVLISIDLAGAPAVKRYQKQYMRDYPDYPIYLDQEFNVAGAFGLSVTPASVLVDKDGKVVKVFSGYDKSSEEEINALYK